MLHAVMLFGTLAVVETVEGANQIPGDAADALEADALTDHVHAVYLCYFELLCHSFRTPFQIQNVACPSLGWLFLHRIGHTVGFFMRVAVVANGCAVVVLIKTELAQLCNWHALALAPSGARLAKRDGAVTLADLRGLGWSTEDVVSFIGSSVGVPQARCASDIADSLGIEGLRSLSRDPWVVMPPSK